MDKKDQKINGERERGREKKNSREGLELARPNDGKLWQKEGGAGGGEENFIKSLFPFFHLTEQEIDRATTCPRNTTKVDLHKVFAPGIFGTRLFHPMRDGWNFGGEK